MDRNVSGIQDTTSARYERTKSGFHEMVDKNIDLLASELGVNIEDERSVEAVGDFLTDIVEREMIRERPSVLKINSIGRTTITWGSS